VPKNVSGTPVFKKKTDIYKMLAGVSMKVGSTKLKKLALRGCEISKQEIKALRKVLEEGVYRLDISYNPLAEYVVDLLKDLTLQEIDLSGCQISDKGISVLCNSLVTLESLKIRDNSLNEENCKMLAKSLPGALQLQHFDISRNFIKDEGACWILSSTAHVLEVFMS